MKTPKEIKITRPINEKYLRPVDAQHHINISSFSIYHNLAEHKEVYIKDGNKFHIVPNFTLQVIDMENLPKFTNMRKNYILNKD
jgi:hypothetical protein